MRATWVLVQLLAAVGNPRVTGTVTLGLPTGNPWVCVNLPVNATVRRSHRQARNQKKQSKSKKLPGWIHVHVYSSVNL